MENLALYNRNLLDYTEDELAVLATAAFMVGYDGEDDVTLTQLAKKMGMSLARWGTVRDRLDAAFQSLNAKEEELTQLRIIEDGSTRKAYRVTTAPLFDKERYVLLTGEEWLAISAPYRAGERYALGTDLRVFLYLKSKRVYDGRDLNGCWAQSAAIQNDLDISAFKWQSAAGRLHAAGVLSWRQRGNGEGDEFDFGKTSQSAAALARAHADAIENIHQRNAAKRTTRPVQTLKIVPPLERAENVSVFPQEGAVPFLM